MSRRTVQTQSRRYSRQIADMLMSVFALELLNPSDKIYLFSAYITDVHVLDNSFGQYRSLIPDYSGGELRLASLLSALAERGSEIFVGLRDDPINGPFRRILDHPLIKIRHSPDLHMKMLVGAHFCWEGSMNFTHNGVYSNPEAVTLSTDSARVSRALLEAEQLWDSLT